MFILDYFLLIIICYLIGSFPTAFLVLKKYQNKDITISGSGNVGALNSYEVSGSKTVGIIVLLIDFLKGLIPSYILCNLLTPSELLVAPLSALILGHNFSVWIKFKGGRGLATSAGIAIIFNFWLLIIWCFLFIIAYSLKRNIHFGNLIATIMLPLLLIFPGEYLRLYNCMGKDNSFESLFTLTAAVCILILLKHINPLIDLIKKYNEQKSDFKNG